MGVREVLIGNLTRATTTREQQLREWETMGTQMKEDRLPTLTDPKIRSAMDPWSGRTKWFYTKETTTTAATSQTGDAPIPGTPKHKLRATQQTISVHGEHMVFEGILGPWRNKHTARVLLDSGATTNFISKGFARNFEKFKLKQPETLNVIDGTEISSGKITHIVEDRFDLATHSEILAFRIVELKDYDLVLGIPWLRLHNPVIDWKEGRVMFTPEACRTHFIAQQRSSLLATQGVKRLRIMGTINEKKPTLIPEHYHRYLHVFDKKEGERLPPHREMDCKIDILPGEEPKNFRIYHMSPKELESLKPYIEELEAKGYLRKSESKAGAPMFFVPKKDGTLRPVVDYRDLNKKTRKDKYPIPLPAQLVDQLQGMKYFTKLDLRNGYNLIRIREGDEWKTAFNCRYGKYEYLVMPFGLCNAPAVFQKYMDEIFKDLIDRGVVVYLDDILMYADNLTTLRELTLEVLRRLASQGLYAKPEKCEFEKERLEYLGAMIFSEGVEMDFKKTQDIENWKTPASVTQIREFLGLANYYRRFIPLFSNIARPIHDLLKKNVKFEWTERQDKAFTLLKKEFQQAPLLVYPDPEKQYYVEADASDYATGGVLTQEQADGGRHPIAFISKSLLPAEKNYDIYDKELLAVVRCFKEWRHHLEGAKHQIIVLTDHKNLEYFISKVLTGRQQRWAQFLQRFDIAIQYKPGRLNNAPDALSRRSQLKDENEREILPGVFKQEQFVHAGATRLASNTVEAIPTEVITNEQRDETAEARAMEEDLFTRRMPDAYPKDPALANIIGMERQRNNDYQWRSGFLLFKNKWYVPDDASIKADLMKLYHDSKLAGHPGAKATQELIGRIFYWPGMGQYIERYVQGCDLCQRVKVQHHTPRGLLKPLEQPTANWTHISYDFIMDLPISRGFNAILVVVDRRSKMGHFIECNTNETAESTARLFYKNIWKYHGLPVNTVSDRGVQFNTYFTRELYRLLDIKPSFSTAYHPQSDGQTERTNQTLEDYLRIFVLHQQDDWADLLPLAEFRYNNLRSNSTGFSPFYLNYGFHPKFTFSLINNEVVPEASNLAKLFKEIGEEADAMLKMSIERYTEQANKHRIEHPEYKVGDKVWLSRKNIKTDRPSDKLDYRRLGPYPITELVGTHAVRLKLMHGMKIHDVVHVNMVEPWTSDALGREPIPLPPVITEGGEEEGEIEQILWSRVIRTWTEYKVRWKGYGQGEDTWVKVKDMGNSTHH